MKEYVALCGQVSPDKSGTPLFTTIGFHSGDARLSRRCIRVQTDKHLRLTGLKRPGVSNHALRHYAGFRTIPGEVAFGLAGSSSARMFPA
jgi:integrase